MDTIHNVMIEKLKMERYNLPLYYIAGGKAINNIISSSYINKSFNHASCQNDLVLLLGEKRTGFCSVKFDVDFVMSKKKIEIKIKPLIIV